MIISLIPPESGETVATYTFTDVLLEKLKTGGIDLVAELPQVALSRNWEDSTLPFRLESYLDTLSQQQKGSTHLVHVVKRETDLTEDDRKLLASIPKRQFSYHDFAMVEYDEEIEEPVALDPAVVQEKAEVSSLIAFFQRGINAHDLLHNDLYPEQPIIEQPVEENVPLPEVVQEVTPEPTPEIVQEVVPEVTPEPVVEETHEPVIQ